VQDKKKDNNAELLSRLCASKLLEINFNLPTAN